MNRRAIVVSLFAAVIFLAGCDDDPDAALCPDGELVELDGDRICVNEVVVETGFLCSEALPHRYERPGHVVCSDAPDLDDETVDEAIGIARERRRAVGRGDAGLPDAARQDPPIPDVPPGLDGDGGREPPGRDAARSD